MKKKLIILISFVLITSVLSAQSIRQDISSSLKKLVTTEHNEGTALIIDKGKVMDNVVMATQEDTLYFRNVVRKYGWLEGLGEEIDLLTAMHLPYYYRMTMKNKKGHFLHVEAMHADSLTSQHPTGNYIVSKTDEIVADKDTAWHQLLKTVSQWLFITNYDGDEVYEERSYDNKNNMIYSYSSVKNINGTIIGSYNDAWGRPADMREDVNNYYGSVVGITYDRNGYDSIIDYLDGCGYRKHNNDGVDQTRYIHNENGYVIAAWSCNLVGDKILDNWGNCGYTIDYDFINGRRTKTVRDTEWNPMRMPDLRANKEQTYVKCEYIQDRLGRDSVATMMTSDGKKDWTTGQIHKILYHYTESGELNGKDYLNIYGIKIENVE